MENNVIDSLKEMDILIKKKLFKISKKRGDFKTPNPMQLKILLYLCAHKNDVVIQKDLEKHLNISKVAVSEAIVKLEGKGLIERKIDENDKRNKIIVLSKSSEEFINNTKKDVEDLNEIIISDISDKELESFFKVLEKFKNNILKDDEDV